MKNANRRSTGNEEEYMYIMIVKSGEKDYKPKLYNFTLLYFILMSNVCGRPQISIILNNEIVSNVIKLRQ